LKIFQASSGVARYAGGLDAKAFLRWWGQGLLACLPRGAQRLFIRPPVRLIVETDESEIIAFQENGDDAHELGRCSFQIPDSDALLRGGSRSKPKWNQVVFRLPGARALSKVVSLPLAAEANLRQVIGFEIDRYTPFRLDQVYYDVHVLDRQTGARRLQVQITVVLRSVLDPFLERLAQLGLSPDVVDVADGNEDINLLPLEKRPSRSRAEARLTGILFLVTLLTLMVAVLLPLWQQRQIEKALGPLVRSAQQEAQKVSELRDNLQEFIQSSRFLVEKKQSAPLVIDILNELTAILPDSTWVEQLEIKDDAVQIRGQSMEASSLIGLVEKSGLFHGVMFLSPVTADRRTGRDRFFLSAQLSESSLLPEEGS
jgi:general secretion pathway protein L